VSKTFRLIVIARREPVLKRPSPPVPANYVNLKLATDAHSTSELAALFRQSDTVIASNGVAVIHTL